MFKFIGTIFAGTFAVSMGSMLVWPIILLACFTTVQSGISRFWPWLAGAIAYAIVAAIMVKLIPDAGAKIAIALVANFLLGIILLAGRALELPTIFIAVSAVLLCLAFSAAVTESERFQALGQLAGVQLLWVAPLTLMLYDAKSNDYSMYVLMATLLGVMGAIVAGAQAWDKLIRSRN